MNISGKIRRSVLLLILALLCASCGKKETRSAAQTTGVAGVMEDQIRKENAAAVSTAEESSVSEPEETETAEETAAWESTAAGQPAPDVSEFEGMTLSSVEGIDIDLTAMSATMVYAGVYDMMMQPENYEGKTIRMEGESASMFDTASGRTIYACIIQDATACCAQGVEFELAEGSGAHYPADGQTVRVTGVFTTYMEDGYLYATLKNAEMEV